MFKATKGHIECLKLNLIHHKGLWNRNRNLTIRNKIIMNIPGKERDKNSPKKKKKTEDEKEWDNPKNPEGTEDQRNTEQIERQLEEAKRRKDNLTSEDN